MNRHSYLGCLCLMLGNCFFSIAEDPGPSPEKAEPPRAAKKNDGERLKQLRESLGNSQRENANLKRMTWNINGTTREALVYIPASKNEKMPLVFIFHGHGGRSEHPARKLAIHEHWPNAIAIYPQGLPTAAPLIDPEGKKAGWQKSIGDQDDRDLIFVDRMLETMKSEHSIDTNRIYSTGHSNGGFFTYVLAVARPDTFAAIAPIAGCINLKDFKSQKPIPVLHVAGEQDPIVKFRMQERSIELVKKLNECESSSKPAGQWCTEFKSANGSNVVTFIHPGGHEIPEGAGKRIVNFFQEYSRK